MFLMGWFEENKSGLIIRHIIENGKPLCGYQSKGKLNVSEWERIDYGYIDLLACKECKNRKGLL